MFCSKCQNDLSSCVCPDLQERLRAIKSNAHLLLGREYLKRIETQAERNIEQEKSE